MICDKTVSLRHLFLSFWETEVVCELSHIWRKLHELTILLKLNDGWVLQPFNERITKCKNFWEQVLVVNKILLLTHFVPSPPL